MLTMMRSTHRTRRATAWLLLVVVCISTLVVAAATQEDGTSPSPSPTPAEPTPSPPDDKSPFPGIPGIPDLPDADDRNCTLLGPFALFTQAAMGIIVLGSLVLKRHRERPKRPWKIWLLDISKQMLGQLFVHILNVILSSLGSSAGVGGEDNPCSLYFLNIAVDTTIGVLFIYYSMRYLTHYFTDVLELPGFVSGQYSPLHSSAERHHYAQDSEDSTNVGLRPSLEQQPSSLSVNSAVRKTTKKPKVSYFFRQLALYLLSILLMKVFVLSLFAVFPFFFDIGRWVLDLFGERKKAQIFFVMALFPLAMNTLQFWLIDSVLRHNPNTSRYPSEEDTLGDGTHANGYADDIEGQGGYERERENENDEDGGGGGGGPWTANWWNDMFRGSQDEGRRGTYQEVGRHSIGEASTENGEDEDGHTYPPVASQSSSVGQLDQTNGKDAESKPKSLEVGRREMTGNGAANAAAAPPPNDDMQEAWDAWSDEENETTKKANS